MYIGQTLSHTDVKTDIKSQHKSDSSRHYMTGSITNVLTDRLDTPGLLVNSIKVEPARESAQKIFASSKLGIYRKKMASKDLEAVQGN